MNQSLTKFFLVLTLISLSISAFTQNLELKHLSTFKTGIFDEGAAEIVAYDAASQRLFFSNANANEIGVLDISDPSTPIEVTTIDLSTFGDGVNSVAVYNGIVAVAEQADPITDPGVVIFFDTDGNFLNSVGVGALPDMVIFTPNGKKVLVANEGEPDDGVDPEGSISIIDLTNGVANATVKTADFTAFNGGVPAGVRLFPDVASIAQDLEPEYITILGDSKTAFATLQEANALAVIDILTATITDILPLGFKDHSLAGNSLDASDKDDAINITNWPVFGMYMPDAITSFMVGGKAFLVTANEGDDRGEDERIKNLELDPTAFPNADELQEDENIGRLGASTIDGDTDDDGDYDQLFVYGSRSFSIWDDEGNLVFDSGNDFEEITAKAFPNNFNASNDENDAEDRSDAKGPEPEAATIGKIGKTIYAFIGLERIGGIMVYDVTDPAKAEFVQYINNRNFDADVESSEIGDLGVEDIVFIDAKDAPNCEHLLVTSNEVSGTVSIFTMLDRIAVTSAPIDATSSSPSIVSVAGGVPPYSANITSNGFATAHPIAPSGSYQVIWTADLCNSAEWTLTIKDANDCEVEISNQEMLKFTSATVTNVSSMSNGAIDITVSGGSDSYTYEWSNGEDTEDISGLTVGNYTVTVTDETSNQVISCNYTITGRPTRGRGRKTATIDSETYGVWLFPNPTQDFTNIHFALPIDGVVNISLFSIEGKEMMNLFEASIEAEVENQISLNTNELSGGIYVLQLTTEFGDTYYQKLFVTK